MINNPEWAKYKLGDLLTKKSGSQWTGIVVGFYSTKRTPHGYAIESIFEEGSVQIYPEKALEKATMPKVFFKRVRKER